MSNEFEGAAEKDSSDEDEPPSGRFSNWCFEVSLWLADISRAAIWLADTVTLLASIWKRFSVEIQLKIEQEKLREKLEREKMLKESNFNEIGNFEFKTEPKPVIKSSSNIMSKSKSKIV